MDKIYIGLSRRKGFAIGSELIKWGEGTEYSHVYIRRKSSRVGEYVYQATFSGGVNFMGIDIFLDKNEIVEEYEFEIESSHTMELVKFFIENAGRDYSFKQILVLSKIILAEKFNLDCSCEGVVDGDDKFICSELGAKVLKEFIEAKDMPTTLDMITPKKLRPYLIEYGKRII